ncbi:MFS transporter [Rhodococcus sp. IEGM 1305]|uniref:MFS transporter n=1 Tax=Rhodococcus sp. IEGM 1305 TaxID=3047092 RepID=UPI0024B68C3B|nr:MFS transporter [Rhodococcus sp. IEGM 1305]MDI9948026.1 MFS transporter [Rhodococcus sp. IEGM 1305]
MKAVARSTPSQQGRTWGLALSVLAVSASTAVSVIYIPQALLTAMATSFGAPAIATASVATAVQIGYACGIFLFVPLADRVHPRRQVTVQSLALAATLMCCAAMPSIIGLAASFFAAGLVANIAQVLIPAVSTLAPEGKAATATGTMVGALLLGVFGGRIVSSVLSDSIGWRFVVLLFAGMVLATVPFTRRALDVAWMPSAPSAKYRALLSDTLRLATRSPELIESAVLQFLVFAVFNMFWTVSVLHLTAEPYGWSILQVGMFGFVGLSAALVTPLFGPAIERFGPVPVIGVALVVLLCACISAFFDAYVLVGLALTMFVVTLVNQAVQTSNQSRVLAANENSAARANTLFMVGVFMGGSVGAVIAPVAYELGGMTPVAASASLLVTVGIGAWGVVRARQNRRGQSHRESVCLVQ